MVAKVVNKLEDSLIIADKNGMDGFFIVIRIVI